MFWRFSNISASSPVDDILDKENVNLEELLDEDGIIQECRALNSRLINFLRDRAQVEQLLQCIVREPSDDTDGRRAFKLPFVASEIFACEIDVILRTLVEDEELMNMLFSFLDSSRPLNSLLAGYFSKVVACLMLRKTVPFMSYVQGHHYVLEKLVDSIGVKSIMEVLVRILGADVRIYPNFYDFMEWLADGNLLEMVVDKLSPLSPPEVHANAAEVIWVISRNAPSPLAEKLYSPSLVSRVLDFTLEDSKFKSSLIHSLSAIISILDPKRSLSSSSVYPMRSQHLYEPQIQVDSKTMTVVLSKLNHLLSFLSTSSDDCSLPTTYGELRPPLGKHRLKIVEFIEVLLGSGDEAAHRALIESGAIHSVIDLFFLYPFNNALHHHVENAITWCLMTSNKDLIDHLFRDCHVLERFLQADKSPALSGGGNSAASSHGTLCSPGRRSPRPGNIGHITRIANKLAQASSRSEQIQMHLQENEEWADWQMNVLHERNAVENVYRWACGRPSAMREKMKDINDDEELCERDYDYVTHLAGSALRHNIYENDVDEDAYFENGSAQVVFSSLRLGDDQERSRLFTDSNWFAFVNDDLHENDGDDDGGDDDEDDDDDDDSRRSGGADDGGQGSSDGDEVVICDVEELAESMGRGGSRAPLDTAEEMSDKLVKEGREEGDATTRSRSAEETFGFEAQETTADDLFDDQQLPDWVGWHQPSDIHLEAPPCADDDDDDAGGLGLIEAAARLEFGEIRNRGGEEEGGVLVGERGPAHTPLLPGN